VGLTGAKSIGQRSKSVAEVQVPFDTFAITTRKRLDAAIKNATDTRYFNPQSYIDHRNKHRQELLKRLEEITEELMELDDAYAERHSKFEVYVFLTLLTVEQDSRLLDHFCFKTLFVSA